jgi:hypothetical protein
VKNEEHQFSAKKIKKKKRRRRKTVVIIQKQYTQVDGKTCLFEIIISYYFYIMLLEASVCMKRTPKASTRG